MMRTQLLGAVLVGGILGLGGCSKPPASKPVVHTANEKQAKVIKLEVGVVEEEQKSGDESMILVEQEKVRPVEAPPRGSKPSYQPMVPPDIGWRLDQNAQDLYLEIYMVIRQAMELEEHGRYQEALEFYMAARRALDLLPPGWQEAIINYRKKYCDDRIRELMKLMPATPPSPKPAPKPKEKKPKDEKASPSEKEKEEANLEVPLQDRYLNLYMLMRNAQDDEAAGRWKTALGKYEEAYQEIEEIRTQHGGFNRSPLGYRITVLRDEIKELKEKIALEGDQAPDARPEEETKPADEETLPVKENPRAVGH